MLRLWYLDNSYVDYVVMTETVDGAWAKLALHGIDRYGSEGTEDLEPAYNDLVELKNNQLIESANDTRFIL